jgi:hypothetical protein
MTEKNAFDRLSDAELAHHRGDVVYAQVQLCKRGDYETVAHALHRSAWVGLWVNLSMLVVVGVTALLRLPWQVLLAQVACMTLVAAYRFIQARRTAETIHRLTEERERLAAESRHPPA